MNVLSLAPGIFVGVAGAGGAYFAYTAATKGVPAAWAMLKTWWTSAANAQAAMKADIASAHSKIASLETQVKALVAKVGL